MDFYALYILSRTDWFINNNNSHNDNNKNVASFSSSAIEEWHFPPVNSLPEGEEEGREGGRGGEGRTGGGVGSRAVRGWEGCGPGSEGSDLLPTGMVSR